MIWIIKKVIDLIGTFSTLILDQFEEIFLYFTSEELKLKRATKSKKQLETKFTEKIIHSKKIMDRGETFKNELHEIEEKLRNKKMVKGKRG